LNKKCLHCFDYQRLYFAHDSKPNVVSAINGEEIGCLVALKWRRKGTGIVTFARPLNFNHLGAKIAEQHGAVGPREYSRQVKHTDAFERSHD
jgi:hypothetical protein